MNINVVAVHKAMILFIIEHFLEVLNVFLNEEVQILSTAFGEDIIEILSSCQRDQIISA